MNGETLEAKSVILAMGSSLDIPDIPGLEEVILTSDQVLDMDEVPGVGAGVSANAARGGGGTGPASWLALWSQGHPGLRRGARILPGEETDSAQRLSQGLREQGIEILPRHKLLSIESAANGCTAVLEAPKEEVARVEVQRILVASRKPNSQGLDEAGVELGDGGQVLVDEYLETSLKGVYAIGDLTGGTMLSHASSSMAIPAAENAMGQRVQVQLQPGAQGALDRAPGCRRGP